MSDFRYLGLLILGLLEGGGTERIIGKAYSGLKGLQGPRN